MPESYVADASPQREKIVVADRPPLLHDFGARPLGFGQGALRLRQQTFVEFAAGAQGLLLETGPQIGFKLRPVLVGLGCDERLLSLLVVAIGQPATGDRDECTDCCARESQEHVAPCHGVCHPWTVNNNRRGQATPGRDGFGTRRTGIVPGT